MDTGGTVNEQRIAEAARALEAEGREAEALLARTESVALAFVADLLAVVRAILGEHGPTIPESICGVVASSLYAKIYGNCRAVYQLCRLGHSLDAPIVNRSAVEALITLRFITISKEECHKRAELWAKFSEVLKWKAAEKNAEWLPHGEEEQRRLRERYEVVKDLFPSERFWAAGLGVGNLFDMAKGVGLEWHHRALYWSASQSTHASAIGVDEYLTIGSSKQPIFRLGLSGRHTKAELAAASDSLIRGLMFLDSAFTLGLKSTLDQVAAKYSDAFGVDPLMPNAEGN